MEGKKFHKLLHQKGFELFLAHKNYLRNRGKKEKEIVLPRQFRQKIFLHWLLGPQKIPVNLRL